MARTRISQREARRLRKRVEELERHDMARRCAYAQEWPGGVEIASMTVSVGTQPERIHVARKLGHAVVALTDGASVIRFIALRMAAV